MKRIPAEQFKKQCLAILDGLAPEGVVIMKGGRPVARVFPVRESSAKLIGALKHRIVIRGDLESTGLA